MSRYQYCQTTSLPWLKEIPSHWKLVPNKKVFTEMKSEVGDKSSEYTLLSLTLKGIIPRDISSGKGKFPASFDKYKIVNPGNMAFCLFDIDETPRTVGLSSHAGMLTGAYTIFDVHDINPKYVYYYYLALDSVKALKPLYTGLRKTIKTDVFLSTDLPVPTDEEQDQIVRYLDWQLSKINKLIAAKKKQIALLKEQRQAVVNHIVKNGIDASATKKQSGIDGLGMIPDNWIVGPLKYFAKSNVMSLGGSTTPELELDYIDISAVGYGYLKSEPVHYTFEEAPLRARRVVHTGDTIISTVRTYLRSICYIDEKLDGCIASTGFSVLTPKSHILPELLSNVLCADYFINAVVKNSIGVSYPAIADSRLLSLKIALPDNIEEQKELFSMIIEKTQSFENSIALMGRQVKMLDELRIRLISDVVTGQMDVRSIEIPEFEYVDDTGEEDLNEADDFGEGADDEEV